MAASILVGGNRALPEEQLTTIRKLLQTFQRSAGEEVNISWT